MQSMADQAGHPDNTEQLNSLILETRPTLAHSYYLLT